MEETQTLTQMEVDTQPEVDTAQCKNCGQVVAVTDAVRLHVKRAQTKKPLVSDAVRATAWRVA